MNWTEFAWKRWWPNRRTILEFDWRDWGKSMKTWARICGVLAEIRTEYHRNTSLDRYPYGNPLGTLEWIRQCRASAWYPHGLSASSHLAPLTLVSAPSPPLVPQASQLRNDKWARHIIISDSRSKKKRMLGWGKESDQGKMGENTAKRGWKCKATREQSAKYGRKHKKNNNF